MRWREVGTQNGASSGAGSKVDPFAAAPSTPLKLYVLLLENYQGKYLPHSSEEPQRSDSMPIQSIKKRIPLGRGKEGAMAAAQGGQGLPG